MTTLVSPPLASQVPPQQSLSVMTSVSSATDSQSVQSGAPEVQNLSKAELMRRERVREELRNEDLLQERLEELRLRDEKRRTNQTAGPAPLAEQQLQLLQLLQKLNCHRFPWSLKSASGHWRLSQQEIRQEFLARRVRLAEWS